MAGNYPRNVRGSVTIKPGSLSWACACSTKSSISRRVAAHQVIDCMCAGVRGDLDEELVRYGAE
jgi:hypothetical protein